MWLQRSNASTVKVYGQHACTGMVTVHVHTAGKPQIVNTPAHVTMLACTRTNQISSVVWYNGSTRTETGDTVMTKLQQHWTVQLYNSTAVTFGTTNGF